MSRTLTRGGLTLIELLIATSLMAMIAMTLGTLAVAVQRGSQFAEGRAVASQHARVVIDRMSNIVSSAYANEHFPGSITLADEEGGFDFPDTLVVWRPYDVAAPLELTARQPVNPGGLPQLDELIIFCPDPARPQELLELRAPQESRAAPDGTDLAAWSSEIEAIKKSPTTVRIPLTDRLRTARLSPLSPLRGAIRFHDRLRPSADEWQRFRSGEASWQDLSWSQDLFSEATGLRQSWVRWEMQLVARGPDAQTGRIEALPFFGSAAIYYVLSP